ncbi:MAG: hypothetical protein WCO61_09175 [Alphaproteobacteria bacterium]
MTGHAHATRPGTNFGDGENLALNEKLRKFLTQKHVHLSKRQAGQFNNDYSTKNAYEVWSLGSRSYLSDHQLANDARAKNKSGTIK